MKIFENRSTLIGAILLAGVAGFFLGQQSGSLFGTSTTSSDKIGPTFSQLEEDKDFYKDVFLYSALLPQKDYLHIKDEIDQLDEREVQNLVMLTAASKLFNASERNREIFLSLRDQVENKKDANAESDTFEKDASCADLTSNVKQDLGEDEEFQFMFYSPTRDSCLYSIEYSSSSGSLFDDNYESQTEYQVYDAHTQKMINEYEVRHSDMSDESSLKEEVEVNRKGYVSFILENSGYNTELLEDISYATAF